MNIINFAKVDKQGGGRASAYTPKVDNLPATFHNTLIITLVIFAPNRCMFSLQLYIQYSYIPVRKPKGTNQSNIDVSQAVVIGDYWALFWHRQ